VRRSRVLLSLNVILLLGESHMCMDLIEHLEVIAEWWASFGVQGGRTGIGVGQRPAAWVPVLERTLAMSRLAVAVERV